MQLETAPSVAEFVGRMSRGEYDLASSIYAVISGQADAAVTTLASLSLTPQRDADKLKVLANTGKIPQLFMMAAPDILNYRVEAATATCLSCRREGEVPLAKLKPSRLRALDSCADQTHSLFKAHLSSVRSNSK